MIKETITEPGIRGWLIVLTIFLFVSPGNFIAHAYHIGSEFNSPVVRQFTDPTSPTFDSRWPMFIFSETYGFTILGGVSLFLLWPLFLLRHQFFRFAFAIVCVAVATLLIYRATLAAIVPTVAQAHRASVYSQTFLWFPVCLALAVYVLRSRRSQITFHRRLAFYPVFPFFTRI